jgi:hypothetical protein
MSNILNKSKSKNIIYLAASTICICDLWIKIAYQLFDRYNFVPKYFFYFDKEKFEFSKHQFQRKFQPFFHDQREALKGIGFFGAPKLNILDERTLNYFLKFEIIALKMMDRMDPMNSAFPLTHRQYYFRDLLLKWLDIVDHLEIDLVISPSTPHQVHDYILYAVCQYKKIPFISFQATPFLDASLIVDNIDKIPDYLKFDKNINFSEYHFINNEIEDILKRDDDEIIWYLNDQKKMELSRKLIYIPFNIYNRLIKEKQYRKLLGYLLNKYGNWTYFVNHLKMPYNSSFTNFSLFLLKIKMQFLVMQFKKKYNKLISPSINLNEYVLFALHYQPEETTSPTGGFYVDQLLILEMLDRFLPNNVTILVKEHPTQFYTGSESSQGRTSVFYDRLSHFSDRVKFADSDISSLSLIKRSLLVVTVIGTIGFESILNGIPVFIFGRTWYEYMEGVFRIKDVNDLKIAWEICKKRENVNLSQKAIYYSHYLAKYMILGHHCGTYVKRTDRPVDESIKNICDGIYRHFKNTT